jgi:putative selenate reductase
VRERHQLAVFQDFCNDCGNCDTFCPEEGGPYLEKPRFFGTLDGWHRWRDRDGYFVANDGEDVRVWARLGRREYALEIDRAEGRAVFSDGALRLEIDHPSRRVLRADVEPGAPEGHVLDVSAYLVAALAVDGVLDPARANPVNCGLAASRSGSG